MVSVHDMASVSCTDLLASCALHDLSLCVCVYVSSLSLLLLLPSPLSPYIYIYMLSYRPAIAFLLCQCLAKDLMWWIFHLILLLAVGRVRLLGFCAFRFSQRTSKDCICSTTQPPLPPFLVLHPFILPFSFFAKDPIAHSAIAKPFFGFIQLVTELIVWSSMLSINIYSRSE